MSDSALLTQAANVLDKLAGYFETVESQKIATEKAKREKAASDLAGRLGEVTGEEVDSTMVEKLSQLDPEVSKFLGKIAGDDARVEVLGGPREQEKLAASKEGAGGRFVDWIIGP